ncbi:hypothetical protein ACYFX5_24600 [Bremerella sp. T1]|uniref:hypothetical protein n=1 Tax=Bremerella sp. TYQ1 TaxID=3119568 RepID=UPI001CCD7ECA|nr:hypothetical protein [Bremerella volcania]UBM36202.1 hypothetical protein LA756_26540 [Bremerella volcania]
MNSKTGAALFLSGVLIVLVAYLYWPSSPNRDRDLPDRFPVSGTVSYNGEAPVGAYVILNPLPLENTQWDTLIPRGRVEEDGTFQVQSYEKNDGAPPGEYAVTMVWTGFPDRNVKPGRDRWRGKFNKPHDPLETIKIDTAEVTVAPIDVKGPKIRLSNPKVDEQAQERGR